MVPRVSGLWRFNCIHLHHFRMLRLYCGSHLLFSFGLPMCNANPIYCLLLYIWSLRQNYFKILIKLRFKPVCGLLGQKAR